MDAAPEAPGAYASPNATRALAALARTRGDNAWSRLLGCALVALVATAMIGNAWALYWYAGFALAMLGERAAYRGLLARCEAGMAPRRLWPLTLWTVLQSIYSNLLAALLWFSTHVSGETLAVIFICGGLANAAATLRSSTPLALAGMAPSIAFLVGLPFADYALSGFNNVLLLTPAIGAVMLVGFGASHWRSLRESDAAQARAEAAAMRERRAAAAAAAAKSDVIKRMNDEMRTPMQALIGAAEHLRRAAATPEARVRIGMLAQAGEVLKLVLDDLSDLDQLENGLVRIEAKPTDPREIARSVVNAFRPAAQDKHLELFLDMPRQEPMLVALDPLRVRQILFNLVANAVRFTVHGGVRVSYNVRASEKPGHVYVSFIVADTGQGISQAQLAQIFARERTAADGEGPGLGLAISLRLARLMSGRLNAKSEPGEGSVFSFTLQAPVAAARNAA